MRIAVIGAGAIGCFLAARLSEHGHHVTLVGRPAQVEAISRDGLTVRQPQGMARVYQLHAATTLDHRPELVLMTVKTQDVEQASRDILPYVARVPVLALQNGLRGDSLAAGVLGRDAIIGGVVMCATSYLNPGEISVQFSGWLVIGEPFGEISPRVRDIAQLLRVAMPTYVTGNMARTRWTKLISNLNNGLSAATGLTMPEVARVPLGRMLAAHVMKEGYRVARAAGIRLDHGLYGLAPSTLRRAPDAAVISVLQGALAMVLSVASESVAERVLALAARSKFNQLPIRGSTWQSIVRGQPTEIDYLNGEVVRLGEQLGVATPYNARLVEVVRDVEMSHQFRTIEELLPADARLPAHAQAGGRQ